MNCNFTCISLEAKICGKTFECSKIDAVYILTMIISIFSSFVSIIWLVATDDVLCSLSKFQYIILTIGSVVTLGIVILNLQKGPYHSKETHTLIKIVSFGVSIIYLILLCSVMYCKCCARHVKTKKTKKLIRQKGHRKNYNAPPGQTSIQQEANLSG
tara:strand:+ start:66 stop:536 length:471 start_codon:yes stop_codon:yes gene_type:complete